MLSKVCIFCVALLVGCASGRVGPRIGLDIPVSGVEGDGNVTSTSSRVGFIGGVTFEGLFNATWGLRADPQIRTIGGDVGFAGSAVSGTGVVSVVGSTSTDVTFVDIPLMFAFNPTDSGSTVHPFMCIGIMLSAATATTVGASGIQTYSENGQSASAPFSNRESKSGLGGPFVSLLFSGGIRVPISSSWEFRAEARLQQLLTDADISRYTLYTSEFRTVTSVMTTAPTTSIGITAGLLLRL